MCYALPVFKEPNKPSASIALLNVIVDQVPSSRSNHLKGIPAIIEELILHPSVESRLKSTQ